MSCATSTSSVLATGSRNSRSTGSVDTLRLCSGCKKFKVPVTSKFKLCIGCRENFRRLAKRRRDSRKILGAMNMERVDDSSKLKSNNNGQAFIKSSSELICTEYQTSSELFGVLKYLNISTSATSYPIKQFLQFHGSYTIVAVSDINNLQRIWLLATELRAKAWLSFQFGQPLSLTGDESTQTLCFACTCTVTSTAPAPVPHGNTENMPVTSTLIRPGVCGGMITLKSIVDKTHPLGIPGQHIVVCVKHPLISTYHPHGHPHIFKP